jgi:uncharacterized protein (TIGR00299 family) protein
MKWGVRRSGGKKMNLLYLDCGMGAAGDMLAAALLELIPEEEQELFLSKMNTLGIPAVEIIKKPSTKCGICGTSLVVTVNGQEEGHWHSQDHDHCHVHSHGHSHGHVHNHGHHHSHGHSHSQGHEHGHDQEHSHGNDADHGNDHKHEHVHSHQHYGMREIDSIIDKLDLPAKVQKDVLAVYSIIAEAESQVHGVPVTDIHFHEVGTMDAIADITMVCLLMNMLKPDRVIVSPVHVGSGQVRCAHGILPVPAPATANILRDVPIYGGSIRDELCTPTGAALLKYFADSFGDMPVMKIKSIGYGMGKKDFDAANCVRAILGDAANSSAANSSGIKSPNSDPENCGVTDPGITDHVCELRCNVDDMTAEEIAFSVESLLDAGALEVFTTPVGMKKSRPGTLITILCRLEDRERMILVIFKYTTTLGVRELISKRYVLNREITTVDTAYGKIRRKDSTGYGVSRLKYEYEDLACIAKEKNISIAEVYELLTEEGK